MGLEMVSRLRKYQGQCRALRSLGHQGYRLRSYKKDPPLHSGYMVAEEIMTLLLESPRTPLDHRALAGLSLVLSHVASPQRTGARSPARKRRIRSWTFARRKMEDPQVRVQPPKNGGSTGAHSPARKWRLRRCAFPCPNMEDPKMRIRPSRPAGSAGARTPTRKWMIQRCASARPERQDPQVRVRPPENGGSAGAHSAA